MLDNSDNDNFLEDENPVKDGRIDIIETIIDPRVKPVVDFIENVMKRTGSASSAHSWLNHIGGDYV